MKQTQSNQRSNLRTLFSQTTNRGQSLLEVVAATMILFIGVTGVSNGFLGFTLRNRRTEQTTGAVSGARTVLDRLRLQDVAALPDGGDRQICNPASDYTCQAFSPALIGIGSVVITFCPDFPDDSTEYCDASVPSRRHVLVEVYDNDGAGGTEITFTAETVFSELRDL
ncbi:MAG: hypothetical protein AAF268_02835 [Cyanobacteria bacterium P01_A01_bin.3]